MTKEAFYQRFRLPPFVNGGDALDIYPCGREEYQLCVKNVDRSAVEEYLGELVRCGFTVSQQRVLCENLFQWLEGPEGFVYVSFMPGISTLRIICGERRTRLPWQDTLKGEQAHPSVTQLGIKLGMCYCILLKDGSFLLIDGGCKDKEDEDTLYRFLRAHTVENKKPVIRAWFMSHTHPDHTDLSEEFMANYFDRVELLAAVYNFPDFEQIEVLHESAENNHRAAMRFESTVKQYYPQAAHVTCHTGEIVELAGVRVTTLMTHEDVYPIPVVSSNHTSCAWRFDFESGVSFMCLGDIWTEMCEQLAKTFTGQYLKADIMQVTHHGLLGGHIDLYRAIDPEICLWPSPQERFEGTWTDPRRVALGKSTVQYCIGEGGCDFNRWLRDPTVKERKHFHAGESVTLPV
ncbi:MAG: hypothetical protein IKC59_08670 [Clostridia bacterium]|nr:hypothetical protein [Clostridia bacterium]